MKGLSVLGAIAELRKAATSFVMSVSLSPPPDETNRLPLHGFSTDLMFDYFSRICNVSSVKSDKNNLILHTKTEVHLLHFLAEFFLEREMLKKKVV